MPCLPEQVSGLCPCASLCSQLISWLQVALGAGPHVLELTAEVSTVLSPTCDPVNHVISRQGHCRGQFCPDLGAVKRWPKRYHPRGRFPRPLAYRGLGCELEQAAPWALGKVFEQSHRLGWAPEGNGTLGSVPGNGMSAQLVFLHLNKGAAMPVEGSELPGSAPTPAWPPL